MSSSFTTSLATLLLTGGTCELCTHDVHGEGYDMAGNREALQASSTLFSSLIQKREAIA